MTLRRALAALCAALLLPACSSLAGEPGPTIVGKQCFEDADCDASLGEVCRSIDGAILPTLTGGLDLSPGVCVIRSAAGSAEVFFEVRPDATGDLPAAQLGPVALGAGQSQALALPRSVEVSGTVRYADDRAGVPNARVRFRSQPLIPGRPLTYDATTSFDEVTLGAYARTLPSGSYSVLVSPPDLRVGTQTWPAPLERPLGEADTGTLDAARTLDLLVSGASQLVPVSGNAIVMRGADEVPLAKIGVWAVEARSSGDPLVGPTCTSRVMSQVATTGEAGWFRVWLPRVPAGAQKHVFCLRFGPVADGPAWPTFEPTAVYEASERLALAAPVVVGALGEPQLLSGALSDVQGQPMKGTSVLVRTHVGEAFRLSLTTVTDDNGGFTANVPPAAYDVIALDVRAPLALCRTPAAVEVRTGGTNEVIVRCPARMQLRGQVLEPASRGTSPLAGVTVVAVRTPDASLPDEVRVEALTESDGTFAIDAGPGTYDLSFQPATTARLPFRTLTGLSLEAGESKQFVVTMPEPFELFGTLESPDRSGVVTGALEAYAVDGNGIARLVGRGVASSSGYSVVVPAVVQ